MAKLGYTLLALLSHGPSTGYDLSLASKKIIRIFPEVNVSQFYPELYQMEADGLIAYEQVEHIERPALPNKKIYSLTEAGQQRLRDWLYQPVKVTPLRDELLIKAYAIWLIDSPRQAANLFREHAELHQVQLDRYLEQEKMLLTEHGAALEAIHSPHFSHYATLKFGISYERAYVEWCEWLVGRLDR
jgi:DNA-binding PadR family transcriptional regulator